MTRMTLSVVLSLALTPYPIEGCAGKGQTQGQAQTQPAAQPQQANQQAPAATPATPTADELYQLVAPIALFPDNLVAQVLAASTFPDQVSAAHTWIGKNSSLKGDQLTQAVDKQPWDASVKALTQFPDVLTQMATNLSWTSALGDAYFNFPKDVMNAVQVMRQRAYSAGNLKSNQQQSVSVQNQAPGSAAAPAPAAAAPPTVIVQPPAQTIVVQPAQPQVVYVPTYNPAVVYGAPMVVYPTYVAPPPPSTGALIATGLISFGVGMAVGAAMSNSWGWNSWGCGWHSSTVVFNRNVYVSNSNTFVNRNNYYNRNVNNVNVNNINSNNVNVNNVNRNNINRNNVNQNNYRANNFNSNQRSSNFTTPNFGTQHNQSQFRNTNGSTLANNHPENRGNVGQNRSQNLGSSHSENLQQRQPSRGYEQQANHGTHSGAFSNYGAGGNARTNSARGQQSLGGGRHASYGGRRR